MANSVTTQSTKRLNAKSVGLGGGLLVGTLTAFMLFAMAPQAKTQSTEQGPGMLTCIDPTTKVERLLPLEKTVVDADISGMAARVTVRQFFKNDSRTPLEAIYTFPLPADAAVDRMNMKIGDRVIVGQIKRRAEAQQIYNDAKNAGKVASLLDQERPNIFTQSVANIMPGAKIEIEISYVQMLPFEDGIYKFVYPMVVGPRYVDGNTPDPGKISPPITPKGTRSGAGIELNVRLNAGMSIEEIKSELHDVDVKRTGSDSAEIALKNKNEIPNRDFVLNYRVAGRSVKSGLMTYADPKNGGFFTLTLMPPKAPSEDQIAPKEVFFVMDQSGSQSGFPIAKSRELTQQLIDALRPNDTFNVLSFNTQTTWLWPSPRPNTAENRAEAFRYVAGLDANGGTDLIQAVREVYRPADDPERRRLVVFNTDGYVGNDFAVLDAVQKNRGNSRMFTFGIGNSVNRFLIDSMSLEGRGDAEFVLLSSEADKAVERFIKRTEKPVLLDVNVTFEGVSVADVMPSVVPDVFADKPIVIRGRYTSPGRGKIRVSGMLGGTTPWSQTVEATFPDVNATGTSLLEPLEASEDPMPVEPAPSEILSGSTIATLWARGMVDEVSRRNWIEASQGRGNTDVQKQIESLGLRFGIMTQFTSFVAVEEKVVNKDGKSTRVHVPVEMPDGVSYEGIFGGKEERSKMMAGAPGGGGYGGFSRGGAAAPSSAPMAGNAMKRPSSNAMTEGDATDSKGSLASRFDAMSDEDVRLLSQSVAKADEPKILAQLSSKQRTRYLRIARLDSRLRSMKTGSTKVTLYFDPKAKDIEANLKKAGVRNLKLSLSAGVGTGDVSVGNFDALAAVEGIQRVSKTS